MKDDGTLQTVYIVVPECHKNLEQYPQEVYGVFATDTQARGYIREEFVKRYQSSMTVELAHGFVQKGAPDRITLLKWISSYDYRHDYDPNLLKRERAMNREIWDRLTPEQREFLGLTQPP